MGVHGHFCFDGQEPPVSVHVHMDAHSPHDHHPDEVHQDADVDLLQLVIAKISKIELGFLLLMVVSLLIATHRQRVFIPLYSRLVPSTCPFAHPPLRAPPFTA